MLQIVTRVLSRIDMGYPTNATLETNGLDSVMPPLRGGPVSRPLMHVALCEPKFGRQLITKKKKKQGRRAEAVLP